MKSIQEIIECSGNLPAAEVVHDVCELLQCNDSVVITAPPGAGKSTLLPLVIMQSMDASGKVLVLEPRRIAARQIAERMACIMGEAVGNTVGYRVRFETKVSESSKVEVITGGVMTRMIIGDPTLDGVKAVVFDEFHERSLDTDVAFALVRETQQILRPDLKIIIMSATIDATDICKKLGAPLIESEGRMFPVEVLYAENFIGIPDFVSFPDAKTVAAAIIYAHRKHKGDILAFLPGQGDIVRCMELLSNTLAPTKVLPLYGNLPAELQHKAIEPSKQGERKVVLATPVAETSITIEGVRIVIDSGLCRTMLFDARTAMSHLETVRISLDMAEQRMGRAGRVAEGVCYRLWHKSSEHLMLHQRHPEILSADLSSTMLSVAAFGESDFFNMPWLTPPPNGSVTMAKELLQSLGAIDRYGKITKIGMQMAAMPCHPRISRMMLSAKDDRMRSLSCDLAALLEEKDPMTDAMDTDLSIRVSALRSSRRNSVSGRWQRIAKISSEYCRMLHAKTDNSDIAPCDIGELIAHAYPERVAVSVDCIGNFCMANGEMVNINVADSMSAYPWIVIASLHSVHGKSGRVFLASPLDLDSVSDLKKENLNISWNSRIGRVTALHETKIGVLTVESKPVHDVDKEKVKNVVCDAVKKYGLSMLAWNDKCVRSLQNRLLTVKSWHPELNIPDLSTEHLLSSVYEWLPFYLENGENVLSTSAELNKLDLYSILWSMIPYDLQKIIDRVAPTHIQMPTGSNIRIEYRLGAESPVLSVRLQECFGMEHTPRVDDGKRAVLMELLSPGFKPVQLTADLQSFWNNAYFDVRKEMRRRYPKHYWPENPLVAEAVKGVKKK